MLQKMAVALGDMKDREQSFYLLIDDITQESCKSVIEWILTSNFLEEKRPDMLTLIICSHGGEMAAMYALIDIMRGSSIPIRTVGIGMIASAGLAIFMAGKKGQRVLTPNTTILSHQYTSGMIGKEHELVSGQKKFALDSQKILNHYKKFTGMNEIQIKKYLLPPQDVWLSAEEAKKYGICDLVIELN